MKSDSTKRFSDRVDNYIKYRPHYPEEIIPFLAENVGLSPKAIIADIGSGTGILSELFLKYGNPVFGVEPNREMREAAEQLLEPYTNFKSVDATAEQSTLPQASVDFILAGQAFHWFNLVPTQTEFRRILKPKGWVILIWNRRTTASPFQQAYEQMLHDYTDDYRQVNHHKIDTDVLTQFFDHFKIATFENSQRFDYDGLKGRLLSSSYAPLTGHPKHAQLLSRLQQIFTEYQENGFITFQYSTQMYYGQLD